jgi:hypothetical protein
MTRPAGEVRQVGPKTLKAIVFIGFFSFFAPGQSWADFRSPRTVALGGAGRANPLLNDAIYQNPSFASFLPNYSWSGNFKALGEGRGRAYSISALDGRSELFQAGLGFQVRDLYSSLHFGASTKINPTVTVGAGAKFFFSKDSSSFSSFRDFSVSASWVPLNWLQLAAVAENLDRTPEMSSLGMERELILASKVRIAEKVMLYADPHFKLGESLRASATALQGPLSGLLTGYEVGAEMGVLKDFYFRLGAFKNALLLDIRNRGNGFGYGFGWVSGKISFDFGVEHTLTPVDQVTHTSGATVFF